MPPSHNTIGWYDANAASYAQEIAQKWIWMKWKNSCSGCRRGTIVDIGCTAGRDTALFHERGLQGTGLDLSNKLLDMARNKIPSATFVYGSMTDMPFPAQSFDGVWAHGVLHHLESDEDIRRTISECFRVSKPGGILHVRTKRREENEQEKSLTDAESGHSRYWRFLTFQEAKMFIEQGGYTVDHMRTVPSRLRPNITWIVALATKE